LNVIGFVKRLFLRVFLQQLDGVLLLLRVVLASQHLHVASGQIPNIDRRQMPGGWRTKGVLPLKSLTFTSAPALQICFDIGNANQLRVNNRVAGKATHLLNLGQIPFRGSEEQNDVDGRNFGCRG
jgi:ABC-type uncharacterized transport system permease subunit